MNSTKKNQVLHLMLIITFCIVALWLIASSQSNAIVTASKDTTSDSNESELDSNYIDILELPNDTTMGINQHRQARIMAPPDTPQWDAGRYSSGTHDAPQEEPSDNLSLFGERINAQQSMELRYWKDRYQQAMQERQSSYQSQDAIVMQSQVAQYQQPVYPAPGQASVSSAFIADGFTDDLLAELHYATNGYPLAHCWTDRNRVMCELRKARY